MCSVPTVEVLLHLMLQLEYTAYRCHPSLEYLGQCGNVGSDSSLTPMT